MSNNSNNYKILQPTVQGSTGSPQQAAFDSQKAAAAKLQSLQNAVGGKRYLKKRTKRGGDGGKIVVPQLQTMYPSVGGPGQTVGDTITSVSSTQATSSANAQFDKLALQSGGNVYMNPNTNKYLWGCYSGGKKYKTRCNKTRKSRSGSRKTRKSRKSRKSRKNRSSKNKK
jgi:hypothetical protein